MRRRTELLTALVSFAVAGSLFSVPQVAFASTTPPTLRSLTSANTGLDHLASLTIATPSTTLDNDVLVLFFETSAVIDPSGLTGWTKIDSGDAGTSLRGQSYYRVASHEPASYTMTFTKTIHIGAEMLDYQSVDTTSPISSHGVVTQGSYVTTMTSGTLSGVGTNDLSLIAFHARGVPDGAFTMTTPSGWTQRIQQTTNSPDNPDVGSSVVEHTGPGGSPTESTSIQVTYVTTSIALRAASGDNPPVAGLSVSPSSGQAPLGVSADASSSTDTDSTPIASYTFDFGDGSALVGPQAGSTASHTYPSSGTYTVKVTVTDTAGLASSATSQVQVSAPAINLVGNPGFETDTNGWQALGSGVTLTRTSGGHSGSWAAKIFNSSSSTVTAELTDSPNWIARTAAGTYTVSAWVRSDSSSQVTMHVQEFNGSKRVGTSQTKVNLTSTWKQITLTYVATAPGASTLDLGIFVQRLASQTGFYVDDVSITLA